jgi:hypothetical protein
MAPDMTGRKHNHRDIARTSRCGSTGIRPAEVEGNMKAPTVTVGAFTSSLFSV